MPTCKLCKTTGPPGASFCGSCGTPFGDEPAAGAHLEASGIGDLFGAGEGGEAELDDLFANLPSAEEAAGGGDDVADLFSPLEEPGGDAADLFAGGDVSSKEADLDDFFGEGAASIEESAEQPVLPPGPAGDDDALGDLFGGGSVDPDNLFASRGNTGQQAVVGGDDLEDLFGDAPTTALPAVEAGGDDDLFSPDDSVTDIAADLFGADTSGVADADALFAAPESEGPGLADPPPAEDLFSGPPAGDPGAASAGAEDLFAPVEPAGDAGVAEDLFGAASPGASDELDDLFGGGGDRADDPGLSFPDASSDSHTVDELSASADDLEAMFGMASASTDMAASSTGALIESMAGPIPDLDDPMDPPVGAVGTGSTAEAFEQLMQNRQEDPSPGVPDLESGDVLAEAHRVVDGGPSLDLSQPPETAEGAGPAPPGPDRRRSPRPRVAASSMAPDRPFRARLAHFVTALGAAAGLGVLGKGLHPALAGMPVEHVAGGFAGAALVLGWIPKIGIPYTLQWRFMVLAGVVLALPHGKLPAGVVPEGALPALAVHGAMVTCLLTGVAHMLENGLTALALRLAFGVVGVYACLSLATGIAEGAPYASLVTRRALDAPGLAGSLEPDKLAKLLKAFDPLFLGVNFFLPATLVAALVDALVMLTRRWWKQVFERLLVAAVLAVGLATNLMLYAELKVPNLLTLAGLGG